MPKSLPRELTSYDLLKTFALVTMIIDHIGYYFFPEADFMRAIGRWSLPVWMFLIGYARSRTIDAPLWGGAVILIAANLVVGMHIFPLSILGTILLVRLIREPYARFTFHSREMMVYSYLIMALLLVPTYFLFDYGTLALGFAMVGYMMRHADSLTISNQDQQRFLWAVAGGYAVYQIAIFNFSLPLSLTMLGGLYLLVIYLRNFRPIIYVRKTASWPAAQTAFFQICGRRTLIIYIAHLLAFKGIAFALGDARMGLFEFTIFGM